MKKTTSSNRTQPKYGPLPGGQALFLAYPGRDAMVFGSRGSGKTYILIMDYSQMVGKGFESEWRGVIVRKRYKQLDDVIIKTRKLFSDIFPKAVFNSNDFKWRFPGGEELLLRNYSTPEDYFSFHGSFFTFIGMDEASSFESAQYLEDISTCLRSTHPTVPRWIRLTTNPFGVGARWLHSRYIAPSPVGTPFSPDGGKTERVAIFLPTTENTILLKNDPHYLDTLRSIEDPIKRRSWLIGDSWEFSGGAFEGIWDPHFHVIPPFPIPRSWSIYRGMDWGSSSPASVLFMAVSDGSPVVLNNYEKIHFPPDHRVIVGEIYICGAREDIGAKLSPSQIAIKIREMELAMGWSGRVLPGAADSSIYDTGVSVARDMANHGVTFVRADKSRGSRVNGFQAVCSALRNSKQYPIEKPGLQIFSTCPFLIKHLPMLQRDENNPEDVCSDGLDHNYDNLRYMIYTPIRRLQIQKLGGL